MPISFNNNFNNDGLLTNASFFSDQNMKGRDDVSNAILNGVGGNSEIGFDFKSIVDLSVAQKMGTQIQSIQSNITNTNIRVDALDDLMRSYQDFEKNILSPFSLDSSLSGVGPTSTNNQAADVKINQNANVTPGISHSVSIQNLAQAESISSAYFTSENELLGEGVFSIDLGSYDGVGNFSSNGSGGGLTISIEEGMTLRDLASEINTGSRDVRAEVITDNNGTRLALFSQKTGADQAMNISVNAVDDPNNAGILSLAYERNDPGLMTIGNQAQDANYTVNGIAFTSNVNQIDDVFGFDLVLKEPTLTSFNISSQANNAGVVGNVEAFVFSYNEMIEKLNTYTADSFGEGGKGSLFRENVAGDIQRELFSLQRTIAQNSSAFNDIGISFKGDQTLNLDYKMLNEALSQDPHSVRNAFSDNLSSNNTNIKILEYGDDANDILTGYTKDGTYSVEVTQAATQASLVGTAIDPVIIGAGGHEFSMEVNGRLVDITFDEGEYTSQQVASRLAQEISSQTGMNYRVTEEGGAISISSEGLGKSQGVSILAGGDIFGLNGTAEGTDIQGRINGVVASGTGTTLTAILNDDSKGLSLDISGNQTGMIGDVTIKRGALSHFSNSVERLSGEKGVMFEAYREYVAKIDESNPDSFVVGLEQARAREEQLRQQYNVRFTASQQAIAAMQNNLSFVKAMFSPDKD